MTTRSWIRNRFARTPRTMHQAPTRFRPRLEALEDRLAPATLSVNTLVDAYNPGGNTLTLRDAITLVNSGSAQVIANSYSSAQQAQISGTLGSNDVIDFQPGLTGTITLGGQLLIEHNLSIQGPGANLLTISGNGASRVFDVDFSLGDYYGVSENCTISGLTIANGSSDSGGGITFLDYPNQTYSLLTANPFPNGTLTIQGCVVPGNSASDTGGGIFVRGNGASATTVNISNTTFSNNQAYQAGAVALVNCTATLTNCTIDGNTASQQNAGVAVIADGSGSTVDVTLKSCTIAGNSGPRVSGLDVHTQNGATSATARYVNTIFANSVSRSPNITSNAGAGVTSQGYNLSDDGTGNLTGPGDQPNTNPLLAPLGNYGGPTPTMALLPGSPAIDAGTGTDAPTTDQRGVSRVAAVDIGAFGSQGFVMKLTGGADQQAIVNTAFAAPLSVQVTSPFGEPVVGGVVTFTAPIGGAGATFPNGNGATINAVGQASVAVAANGTVGSYSVGVGAKGSSNAFFISLSNLAAITLSTALAAGTYGSPYNETITASGGTGSPYTFTVPSGTQLGGLQLASNGTLTGTPTAAGMFTLTVLATDKAGFTGSQRYTLTINKATPTTAWSNPSAITYGTALSAAQLNATANIPGTFAYSPAAYTVLSVGSDTLSVTFTPTDTADYNNATATVSLTVNPAPLTITAKGESKTYGTIFTPDGTTQFTASGLLNGNTISSVMLTSSGYAATASVIGSPYAITPSAAAGSGLSNYTISYVNGMLTVTAAPLTITAKGESKTYGTTFTPDGTSQFTSNGLANGDTITSVTLTSGGYAATATVAGSPYAITASGVAGSGLSNYTISYVNGTLSVKPAPLSGMAINFSATAGAPFSGTVASFSNVSPNTSAYTALIDWGDGSTSTVSISVSGSSLTVTGAHTYADPKSYTVGVQISNPNTTTAKLTDAATVTSLGQGVVKGLAGGIGFWQSNNGQALIKSFNGGSTATALSAWLAATFPNLYGASAGAKNLSGKSNAQVAAFYLSQFNQSAPQAQAQVLAVALNVYATTTALGGNAAAGYGFSVSASGLGARSLNVGSDGAAFGVANNTTRNVYALLVAVNQQAVNGVPYNGKATPQAQCADLFSALNQAGSIG